jgi:hypothetical protein
MSLSQTPKLNRRPSNLIKGIISLAPIKQRDRISDPQPGNDTAIRNSIDQKKVRSAFLQILSTRQCGVMRVTHGSHDQMKTSRTQSRELHKSWARSPVSRNVTYADRNTLWRRLVEEREHGHCTSWDRAFVHTENTIERHVRECLRKPTVEFNHIHY